MAKIVDFYSHDILFSDFDVCKELYNKMKSTAAKMGRYESFYIDLIKCLFIKMANTHNDSEMSVIDFMVMILEMLVNLPKENVLDEKQMEKVCQALQDCVMITEGKQDISEPMKKSTIWLSFVKMSLKFGLQPHQDASGKLLGTLAMLCDIIYENNAEEPQINKIHQWTLSHSEFLNVMLGKTPKKCKF
jgi:hypothetical protein